MNIPNRITLNDLRGMQVGAIAALPAEELAQLHGQIAEEVEAIKRLKDWLDGAIALKYTDRAAQMRLEAAKDTGTVRFEDDGVTVISDLPKKVEWDQFLLKALTEKIKASGEDPSEYVKTKFEVSERAYGAWPSHIRTVFEPARTVRTGKMSFKLVIGGEV